MSTPSPIPEALIEIIAQRFRAMGEPMRLRILDALRDAPSSPMELHEQLGTTPQNISKHLGVLHAAGLVGRQREGSTVQYWISDPTVLAICEEVCGGVARQVAELNELMGGRA